ncbi:type II toxin-antitoxin system RelE/ParE family toxin [Microbacteriaceae bacterium K1510]|nr:type II toxin-antitoxin system RelE/ParE family toxin [Microbacteriaceae bacterium K1510]
MILLSEEAAADVERVRYFLDANNPEAAKRALARIFVVLEKLQDFPQLGRPTEDADIRQIVIRFGSAGYIVRYAVLANSDILIIRLWHGREARE